MQANRATGIPNPCCYATTPIDRITNRFGIVGDHGCDYFPFLGWFGEGEVLGVSQSMARATIQNKVVLLLAEQK